MAYGTHRQVSRVVNPAFRARKTVKSLSLSYVFCCCLITFHLYLHVPAPTPLPLSPRKRNVSSRNNVARSELTTSRRWCFRQLYVTATPANEETTPARTADQESKGLRHTLVKHTRSVQTVVRHLHLKRIAPTAVEQPRARVAPLAVRLRIADDDD